MKTILITAKQEAMMNVLYRLSLEDDEVEKYEAVKRREAASGILNKYRDRLELVDTSIDDTKINKARVISEDDEISYGDDHDDTDSDVDSGDNDMY